MLGSFLSRLLPFWRFFQVALGSFKKKKKRSLSARNILHLRFLLKIWRLQGRYMVPTHDPAVAVSHFVGFDDDGLPRLQIKLQKLSRLWFSLESFKRNLHNTVVLKKGTSSASTNSTRWERERMGVPLKATTGAGRSSCSKPTFALED